MAIPLCQSSRLLTGFEYDPKKTYSAANRIFLKQNPGEAHLTVEELQQMAAPTFFFTFSSTDMHWPDLHALFSSSLSDTTPESKRQNFINNPHITDWFFTQRLENFIKHWLHNSLDAEWHWYRFEYQARGSIHCHGVAKLKNDPGLCQLSETALKGYLTEVSLDKLNNQIF